MYMDICVYICIHIHTQKHTFFVKYHDISRSGYILLKFLLVSVWDIAINNLSLKKKTLNLE